MPDGTYIPTLQFQPYVAPIAQAPVKEVDDLGKLLNQRYDENISQFDKLDEVGHQIQVLGNDEPLKQGLLSDTRNIIANIAKNGDWENARPQVREVARRFSNDPVITKAVNNYQTVQKLKEDARQAEMNGAPQIQFRDLDNFSTVDPTTGKVQTFDPTGVFEKKLDYESKMNSIFDGIHASGSSTKSTNLQRDGDNGPIVSQEEGSGWSGITKKDIINAANRNFTSYLASAEGQQRLKVLTSRNSDNAHPVDPATALNLMKQELINTGLNRVYSETQHTDATKLPHQPKVPGGGATNTSLQNDISYQSNQDLGDLTDYLKNKKYGPNAVDHSTDGTTNSYAPGAASAGGLGPGFAAKVSPENPLSEGNSKVYKNLFDVISSQLGTKDPKVVDPKIRDYVKSISNGKIQPTLAAYNDTKDIDAANNYFRNGEYQGSLYLDPATNKQMSWAEVTKNYKNQKGENLSDEDADKAKVVGVYNPDNPFYDMTNKNPDFASAKKVIIGGHSFVVGANAQDKATGNYAFNRTMADVSSSRRLGIPTDIGGGVKVVSDGKDGYYITRAGEAPHGKMDGTPYSLQDIMQGLQMTGGIK